MTILTLKGNRENCQKGFLYNGPDVSYLALTMFPGDVMSRPAFCGGRMET